MGEALSTLEQLRQDTARDNRVDAFSGAADDEPDEPLDIDSEPVFGLGLDSLPFEDAFAASSDWPRAVPAVVDEGQGLGRVDEDGRRPAGNDDDGRPARRRRIKKRRRHDTLKRKRGAVDASRRPTARRKGAAAGVEGPLDGSNGPLRSVPRRLA